MIRGVNVILGLDVIGSIGGVQVSNVDVRFGLGASVV